MRLLPSGRGRLPEGSIAGLQRILCGASVPGNGVSRTESTTRSRWVWVLQVHVFVLRRFSGERREKPRDAAEMRVCAASGWLKRLRTDRVRSDLAKLLQPEQPLGHTLEGARGH